MSSPKIDNMTPDEVKVFAKSLVDERDRLLHEVETLQESLASSEKQKTRLGEEYRSSEFLLEQKLRECAGLIMTISGLNVRTLRHDTEIQRMKLRIESVDNESDDFKIDMEKLRSNVKFAASEMERLKAEVEQLTKSVADLKAEHEKIVADLKADRDQRVADLKAERDAVTESLSKEIGEVQLSLEAQLREQAASHKKEMDDMRKTLDELAELKTELKIDNTCKSALVTFVGCMDVIFNYVVRTKKVKDANDKEYGTWAKALRRIDVEMEDDGVGWSKTDTFRRVQEAVRAVYQYSQADIDTMVSLRRARNKYSHPDLDQQEVKDVAAALSELKLPSKAFPVVSDNVRLLQKIFAQSVPLLQ